MRCQGRPAILKLVESCDVTGCGVKVGLRGCDTGGGLRCPGCGVKVGLRICDTINRFVIERTCVHSVHVQENYALNSLQRYNLFLSTQYAHVRSIINLIYSGDLRCQGRLVL